MWSNIGLTLIVIGVLLVLLGLVVWSGAFSWFGKLPGDIRIERDNVRIYIPLISMALLSLALSLLFYILRRIFK